MPTVPEGPAQAPQAERPTENNMLMAAADMDAKGKFDTLKEVMSLMTPNNNIVDWISYAARKSTGDLFFPMERLVQHRMEKINADERLTRENREVDSEEHLRPRYEGKYR